MKLKIYGYRLLAADPADGNGTDKEKAEKKAGDKKIKMVKVRNNTAQPIAIDGIVLHPRVLGKDGKVVKEAPEIEVPEKHLDRLGKWVTEVVACLLLAALLMFAGNAGAQQYNPAASTAFFATTNGASTLLNGGTNTIAANSTNTYNSKVGLTKYDEVSLEISYAYTGAGTGIQTFNFASSNDGTNRATAGQTYSFTLAGNGTTPVTLVTNIYVGASGYLFLTTGANTNATLITTNLLVRAVPKPSRRGS